MIDITAEAKDPIPVKLVGVDYNINPPKTALAMKLAVQAKLAGKDPELVMVALDDWVNKAFGPVQAAAVRARMDDENDLLDFDHLLALMEAVIEATTENPTTSSSGSRRSRSKTGKTSTAGLSAVAST